MQNHHLETLVSSLLPSTMNSMIQSSCLRWGSYKHPSLANKGHKLAAYRWNRCLQLLVVATTKVIAGHMTPTENHLISPKDLFELNLKQLGKNNEKLERWVPSPSYPKQMRRKGRKGGLGATVTAARSRRCSRLMAAATCETPGGGLVVRVYVILILRKWQVPHQRLKRPRQIAKKI